MTEIRYGGQNYQVSAEFRGTLMRSYMDDNQISAGERNVLAQQASTEAERAFLQNHVQLRPGQDKADFDPSQLSFGETFVQPRADFSDRVLAGQNMLSGYSAERLIPLDVIAFTQSNIERLRTSGDTPGADHLQGLLNEKIDQAMRFQLQTLDRELTAVSRDGQVSPEEKAGLRERSALLSQYMQYRDAFSPETQRLGAQVEPRLINAINGIVPQPSSSEASDGPGTARLEWNTAAGASFRLDVSDTGSSEQFRAAVAGGVRFDDGSRLTGYLGFSQVWREPNPEASLGPYGPRDRESSGFVAGLEYETGPSRLTAEASEDGRFSLAYERQLSPDQRTVGEVRVTSDGDETVVGATLRVKR